MAWRIEEYVIRGEIDCRVRNQVTGKVWLVNRPEPLTLSLTGNPLRDLAGLQLTFVNPHPVANDLARRIRALQQGHTGDLTASRKVRVPDIPIEEIGEYLHTGKSFPWYWGNCLYLEWYDRYNGRVVIESTDYLLTVSLAAPTWTMTEAEEKEQSAANVEQFGKFLESLADIDPRDIPKEPDEQMNDEEEL